MQGMSDVLLELLTHGSAAVLFVLLVLSGFGFPIPEDLVLLTGGALAHQGVMPLPAVVIACVPGVIIGDLLIFRAARRLGPAAMDRPMFRRVLPPERRERIERLYKKYGGALVFFARHVAGFRAAVFAMAGIQGMSTARFVFFDVLGLCISAPLMLGLGYLFSDHIEQIRRNVSRVDHYVIIVLVLALATYTVWAAVRRGPRRRRRKDRVAEDVEEAGESTNEAEDAEETDESTHEV